MIVSMTAHSGQTAHVPQASCISQATHVPQASHMPQVAPMLNLYQIYLYLPKLMQFMSKRGMGKYGRDLGYGVHSLLNELWPQLAPEQFQIEQTNSLNLKVLAYGSCPWETLQYEMQLFTEPALAAIVNWELSAGKVLPSVWPTNIPLALQVTCCPIKRTHRRNAHHSSKQVENYTSGNPYYEIDAYLCYLESLAEDQEPLSREEIYLDWFRDQFERFGGVSLLDASLTNYRRVSFKRRARERQFCAHAIGRYEATIEALFTIQDAQAFLQLINRGIGRHRAFGYGMILLRKPGQS